MRRFSSRDQYSGRYEDRFNIRDNDRYIRRDNGRDSGRDNDRYNRVGDRGSVIESRYMRNGEDSFRRGGRRF